MERQTNIMGDAAALQLGNSLQTKGKGKGKGKAKSAQKANEASGGSDAPAPKNNAAKKPRAPRKTKTPAAPAVQFYEKSGLKINLFEKSGRKRACARLASKLRKKGEDDLLDIVGEYAGAAKRQEFKNANLRKQEIAEWIEEMETLALGPCPGSKLVGIEQDLEWAESISTHKEDEVPETIKPVQGTKRPLPEEQPPSQPAAKQQKRDNTPEPNPVARPVKHASPKKQPARVTQMPNGAKTPTHSQQIGKSPEKPRTPGPVTASSAGTPKKQHGSPSKSRTATTPKKQNKASPKQKTTTPKKQDTEPTACIDAPMPAVPEISSQHTTNSMPSSKRTTATYTEEKFMESIGLDASHPFTATKVVQFHAQHKYRILTAHHRPSSAALPPQPSFHSITVQHGYSADNNPRLHPAPAAFLKPGRHGAGGDFADDPDRASGRGHDYDPKDAAQYQEYMAFKQGFYKRWPLYPRLMRGETVHEDVLKAWLEWRVWHEGFGRKYPGRRGDQWVCGCGKVETEVEMDWEEGDSEEE